MSYIRNLLNIVAVLLSLNGVGYCSEMPLTKLELEVANYINFEMASNWDEVYSYRTRTFQNSVIKDDFVSTMRQYSQGWKLTAYEIKNIRLADDVAFIDIEFTEVPPQEFWGGSGIESERVLITRESAIWIMEGDIWRCRVAPTRGHLPFSE